MCDEIKTRVRALFDKAREARIPAYKIGQRARLTPATLANWNTGKRQPTFGHLLRAEAALGELVAEKNAGVVV